MESEMNRAGRNNILVLAWVLHLLVAPVGNAQEPSVQQSQPGKAGLQLRKTIKTKEYQGKLVEGEERVIERGDTVWRILIQEKGIPEKRFGRYLVVLASFNPHLKNLNILRIGDLIFIPMRPDEVVGIQAVADIPDKGEAAVYKVKPNDSLFSILQEQLGLEEKQDIQRAYNRVKALNPEKTNWDLLFVGETIRLPERGKAQQVLLPKKPEAPKPDTAKSSPVTISPEVPRVDTRKSAPVTISPELPKVATGKSAPVTVGLDYAQKIPAQENLGLLEQVIVALGNQINRSGQEVVPLKEGTIRIDRQAYPVIHNPKAAQQVILDSDSAIPAGLQEKLAKESSSMPVVKIKKGASLHDAVNSLLLQLGFQTLASNRPVVVRDGGVGLEVKGNWMVVGPEENNRNQEVFVVILTDASGKTPDYLKEYLSLRGMNLKDILIPSPSLSPVSLSRETLRSSVKSGQVEVLPQEKSALLDALLKTFQIPYDRGQRLSVSVAKGMRFDTLADRFFEFQGKRYALFFRFVGEEVKKALEKNQNTTVIDIDLKSFSSQQIVSRLLESLGEPALYKEHRFPLAVAGAEERLTVKLSGFFLPSRSLMLTDGEIPKELERFFFERDLRLVQFK